MKRSFMLAAAALAACATATDVTRNAPAETSWDAVLDTTISPDWADAENRAFDFWIGEWRANWRPRSEGQLVHDAEGTWTHQRVFPIFDGKAIVELAESENAPDGEPSGRGFSIRYFDPARERWIMAQHWPNPNFDGVAFTDQLIGFEHHGRLSMYSRDSRPHPDGGADHRRYNFSDIAEDRFRWDGSNTSDDGATWTTWQVVDFHRTGPQPALPRAGGPFPGVYDEHLCADPPHRALDALEGAWTGTVTFDDERVEPARLTAGRLLDGCAVVGVVAHETSGFKRLIAWSYSSLFGAWASLRLDNRPGSPHSYEIASEAGSEAVFVEAPSLAIANEQDRYMIPAGFDTSRALTRTRWTSFTNVEVSFEEDARDAPDAEWRTTARYALRRTPG